MQVVDGNEHRPTPGQQLQGVQDRSGHGAFVHLRLGVAEQQLPLQRAALNGRELRQEGSGVVVDEVGQPGERPRRLGLGGPSGQDPVPGGGGVGDTGGPHRGLADPGRPHRDGGDGQSLRAVEHSSDAIDSVLSADQGPHGHGDPQIHRCAIDRGHAHTQHPVGAGPGDLPAQAVDPGPSTASVIRRR